jgi:hypothetical protein
MIGQKDHRRWQEVSPREREPGGAPAPLSELSVAQGSTSVPSPDFTRGAWSEKRT